MKIGSALFLVVLLLSASAVYSKSEEKKENKAGESKRGSISTEIVNKTDRNIAALINGVPVYESDLGKKTLEEAIDDELLYQAAVKAGVDKVIEPLTENYKKNQVIEYYKDKIPANRLDISDDEIRNYYDNGDYETISVTEVSFTDRRLASEFYKKAISGRDFLKLANGYTNVPFIAEMHVKIDDSYRDLFKGKKEGAIIYANGKKGEYKVVRLNERSVISYDSVRQSIASRLLRERIYEDAVKNGIDEELNRKLEAYEKNMVLENFRQNVLAARSQVTEEEILAFYNAHEYQRISVRELIFKDKALADQAHARIVSGEEFDSVSEEYSKDPSKGKIKNTSNPPYQDIFKGKDVGVVSEVIPDDGSFKIVKLVKRDKIPLEELRSHITTRVREKKAETAENELIKKLRGESKIEVLGNKFNQIFHPEDSAMYAGRFPIRTTKRIVMVPPFITC